MEYRWAVDTATGEFLYGGADPYDCVPGLSPTQSRVVLDRAPNLQLERYSGNPDAPFLLMTAAEVTQAATALTDALAARAIDQAKAIRATVICSLWDRLNRQPTGPEIAAERTRWLTIYKAI